MQTDSAISPKDTKMVLPSSSMLSLRLGISTDLLLDPGLQSRSPFSRKPRANLAALPVIATTTATDPETREKVFRAKANIHLVAHGAIRLFGIEDKNAVAFRIKTIEIDPSLLLHGDSNYPLAPDDLPRALTRVQREVAPLLANSEDSQHIIPGVSKARDQDSRTSWRYITSTVTFVSTPLHQCHGVAHPEIGPVEGATSKCLQVGTKGDDLIITFESVKVPSLDCKAGEPVAGIRATVSLRGRDLIKRYRHGGETSKIGKYFRLTRFGVSTLASVHEEVLSELGGIYLIPSERPAKGRSLTPAKAIAWMSVTTSWSVEQLISRYVEMGSPSKSTIKRLNRDIQEELARLSPLLLSSRFMSEFHAKVPIGLGSPATGEVDPRIAKLYA